MTRILLIVAALIALMVLSKHLKQLSAQKRKQFYIKLGVFGLVVAVIILTLTGRLHFIAAVVAAILPFIKKLWPLIRYVPLLRRLYQHRQAAKQPGSGNASYVTTNLLKMVLDHDSGDLDGEVLDGPYQGKSLSALTLDELLHIYRVAQSDYADSVSILEAYLDRMHGEEWRDEVDVKHGSGSGQQEQGGEMSLKEAYAILGLEEGASEEEVVQAHRKLMQKLHPDRGGSDFLAAQVNRAKDLILQH